MIARKMVLDALKGGLLRVDDDGIHVLSSSNGDSHVEAALSWLTQIDEPSLDSGEVPLEGLEGGGKFLALLRLLLVVACLAQLFGV